MKPKQWGLVALISALFLASLAIPALPNSDNSDIVAPTLSKSPIPTPSTSQSATSTPSPKPTSTPSSPSPEPTRGKKESFEVPHEFLESLIGMYETEAKSRIAENDYLSRVVHRDGEDFMVTADYRYNRINLYINGGIVFDATVG